MCTECEAVQLGKVHHGGLCGHPTILFCEFCTDNGLLDNGLLGNFSHPVALRHERKLAYPLLPRTDLGCFRVSGDTFFRRAASDVATAGRPPPLTRLTTSNHSSFTVSGLRASATAPPMEATESESLPIFAANSAVCCADCVTRARPMARGTIFCGVLGKYWFASSSTSHRFRATRSE